MSQENVETVQRVYEGVNVRIVPQEMFARDFELDQRDVFDDAGEIGRGLEAALVPLREYWETFEDFYVEIEEVIHADDGQVITAVRDGGQIRGTDAEVRNRFFHVWTFGDGKIIRLSLHAEKNQALKAAGLSE